MTGESPLERVHFQFCLIEQKPITIYSLEKQNLITLSFFFLDFKVHETTIALCYLLHRCRP